MSSFGVQKARYFFTKKHQAEEGQILLVVVLLMVVILTIGLSVATRNISNFRQSSEEDQSQRAFSAAEAGIQVALERDAGVNRTNFNTTTTYETELLSTPTREITPNGGGTLLPNEAVDVWLAGYPSFTPQWSGRPTIYWGESNNSCSNAALEITVLSGTVSSPTITQYAYDPCSRGNGFSSPQPSTRVQGGIRYYHEALLPFITDGLIMRIVPIYRGTRLSVVSSTAYQALPVQQRVFESTGTAGETSRKIVVSQSFPKLPLELFPYVLFIPQ